MLEYVAAAVLHQLHVYGQWGLVQTIGQDLHVCNNREDDVTSPEQPNHMTIYAVLQCAVLQPLIHVPCMQVCMQLCGSVHTEPRQQRTVTTRQAGGAAVD